MAHSSNMPGKSDRKTPSKRAIVEHIQAHLSDELASLSGSPDTGAGARAAEIEKQLVMFRFLPLRDYSGPDEVAVPSALVELEFGGREAFYFLVPSGGGLIMRIEEHPVQVITPQSPLGVALMGRKAGDEIDVQVGGGMRRYRVKSIS